MATLAAAGLFAVMGLVPWNYAGPSLGDLKTYLDVGAFSDDNADDLAEVAAAAWRELGDVRRGNNVRAAFSWLAAASLLTSVGFGVFLVVKAVS